MVMTQGARLLINSLLSPAPNVLGGTVPTQSLAWSVGWAQGTGLDPGVHRH